MSDDAGVSQTAPSLLRAASLLRNDGTPNAALLSDGVASTDGDIWNSPRAALIERTGVVEWDLGAQKTIAAMRLQADNNDRYTVQGSLDRATWYPVWVAPVVELPGVQTRTSPPLNASARYLRLTAEGGDNLFSVTELEVFDSQEALRGAQLTRAELPPPKPPPTPPPFDTGILVVFGVAAAFVWFFRWVRGRYALTAPVPAAEKKDAAPGNPDTASK